MDFKGERWLAPQGSADQIKDKFFKVSFLGGGWNLKIDGVLS